MCVTISITIAIALTITGAACELEGLKIARGRCKGRGKRMI